MIDALFTIVATIGVIAVLAVAAGIISALPPVRRLLERVFPMPAEGGDNEP